MYSSWLLISSCLTNLLNSLNVSQSSVVPDCLALSYLLFLASDPGVTSEARCTGCCNCNDGTAIVEGHA